MSKTNKNYMITYGKDEFFMQITPCFVSHEAVVKEVFEVVLENGQRVKAFDKNLFTDEEMKKEVERMLKRKKEFFKTKEGK